MSSSDAGARVHAHSSAGVDAVWRCLADPYSFAEWVAGTATIRRADPDWPAAGARLYHQFDRGRCAAATTRRNRRSLAQLVRPAETGRR